MLVLAIAERVQAVTKPDDARRRAPRFREGADLDEARRLRRDLLIDGSGRGQQKPAHEHADAESRHRASTGGADSASSASMSARARAPPHARAPTAKATARPFRPMTNVVGRPITPYCALILPSTSSTSGNVRRSCVAYRLTLAASSRALIPTTASPCRPNSRWRRSRTGISGRHSRSEERRVGNEGGRG